MPDPQDDVTTLTDQDIETRRIGASDAETRTDTGDDTGDVSDTTDTGDDAGDSTGA